MKTKLFYILLPLLAVFAFSSCENDEDKMYSLQPEQINSPALASTGFTVIKVDETNMDQTPVILNWTKSDFGTDVLVEYSLEMSDRTDFSNAYTVSVGNSIYSRALKNSELSEWVIDKFNGIDENEIPQTITLNIRVSATIALENPRVTVPPPTVVSNAVAVTVTPHYIPAAYPSELFMIGKDFGDWSWGSEDVAEMIPVHGNEGNFWCIRYITAGNGFKWNSKREWGGDFFSIGEDLGFTTDDGNAFVAQDGLYMVFVDYINKRISVEPAKVYGMGDCFGGWDTGKYPFTVDGRMMKITTAAAGEIRMYAMSDIAPVGGDWWRMEFVPINGVIAYRADGDDQERVTVQAGKEVVLDFNAGTGIFK